MPRIITFTAPKGGCGSTFVSASLCYMFVQKSQRVLALDMCFERCTLDSALGFQNDYVYTLKDVTDGECTLKEAVCSFDGVDFVRCGYEKDCPDYEKIADVLKNSDYDFVIIDMPSFDDDIKEGVLSFSDQLVLVTDTSSVSQKMCDLYIKDTYFENTLLVVNKIIPSYIKMGIHMTLDEIVDAVGVSPIGLIEWSPCVDIVLKNGTVSGLYESRLYCAFSNIALRLMGERIPAMDITRVYDCFKIKAEKKRVF